MNKYIRSAVASLLVLVIVLTTYLPTFAVGERANTQPTKYSGDYNSGDRDVVATTLNGTSALSYYGDNYSYEKLSEMSANDIKTQLAKLMQSTHSYQSSYNDCHYKADRTDCENEDKSVSLIYTSYSATMSQWNGWNREHVWPQSLGGGNTSGGGADLHHIRPSDAVVNSTRGNKKYGNTNGGTAKYGSNPATGYLGGYYNSTYFEPLDNVKGDVARICLYVWVRWGSAWGATDITKVFQSVDVLLEWMLLDPVDTWELGRNEVIGKIQGNRNVFIDYPEYAWLIFGREVPEGMTTPSGMAMKKEATTAEATTDDITASVTVE
ncbi:MAG: endonuclease, partial [Clostridia bacterium]|nr:endonuclease [Clostridia bacterium]